MCVCVNTVFIFSEREFLIYVQFIYQSDLVSNAKLSISFICNTSCIGPIDCSLFALLTTSPIEKKYHTAQKGIFHPAKVYPQLSKIVIRANI